MPAEDPGRLGPRGRFTGIGTGRPKTASEPMSRSSGRLALRHKVSFGGTGLRLQRVSATVICQPTPRCRSFTSVEPAPRVGRRVKGRCVQAGETGMQQGSQFATESVARVPRSADPIGSAADSPRNEGNLDSGERSRLFGETIRWQQRLPPLPLTPLHQVPRPVRRSPRRVPSRATSAESWRSGPRRSRRSAAMTRPHQEPALCGPTSAGQRSCSPPPRRTAGAPC